MFFIHRQPLKNVAGREEVVATGEPTRAGAVVTQEEAVTAMECKAVRAGRRGRVRKWSTHQDGGASRRRVKVATSRCCKTTRAPGKLVGGVEPAQTNARPVIVHVIHFFAQLACVGLEQLRDPAAVVGALDQDKGPFLQRHHLHIPYRFRLRQISAPRAIQATHTPNHTHMMMMIASKMKASS